MPLNIEVKGDPASIRETSRWLRSTSGSVEECGSQVRGARNQSESGWTGPAGNGFRGVMTRAGGKVYELGDDLGSTAGALDAHADDLDTVKSRMTQARQIADEGGLATTETAIAEPGPAPAEPTPLPTGRQATAAEKQAHTAATEAASAYTAKVKAYQEAGKVVTEARKKETDSQNLLLKFLKGQVEKSPFTITDFATGLAGATAARTSKFRATAARYARNADVAGRLMGNRTMSAAGRLRATILHVENRVNAAEAARKATATRLARAVDRLPSWAKAGLKLEVGDVLDKTGSRVLSNAPRVLRRVPVVGAFVTVAGIGYDISQGKDPVQSTVSGVSSFAAGAAVGAMIGGPVGLVAGAVVGAGVGFVVDEWGDDIAEGVGDAAGWVGDKIGGLFG